MILGPNSSQEEGTKETLLNITCFMLLPLFHSCATVIVNFL